MKILISSIMALAMLSFIVPAKALAQLPPAGVQDSKISQIKVKGITCASDVKTIASNIEKMKGVISCKPGKQGTTTTFEVRFDNSVVTEKEIHATIENTAGCENPQDRPYKVKL